MRSMVFGLACALVLAAPAAAVAADAAELSFTVDGPKFPSPLITTILGLSLTAVAVVGARVSNRSSDTMMYMVLASLAVTAIMVAFADRLHEEHWRAGVAKLQELVQSRQSAAVK